MVVMKIMIVKAVMIIKRWF